eukprot:CAMPEP_0172087676 /NCGR_PEP_ID=MMETSP1043-20130122/22813_1 /TAXON_ID=464988 /ORGANISM="Hemiselmis andersenii, Strain CCMP441" /LENGTH=43 /DNA_ID= /DNA_START= /DNA_END= /DNA_ORIENTATION=
MTNLAPSQTYTSDPIAIERLLHTLLESAEHGVTSISPTGQGPT